MSERSEVIPCDIIYRCVCELFQLFYVDIFLSAVGMTCGTWLIRINSKRKFVTSLGTCTCVYVCSGYMVHTPPLLNLPYWLVSFIVDASTMLYTLYQYKNHCRKILLYWLTAIIFVKI